MGKSYFNVEMIQFTYLDQYFSFLTGCSNIRLIMKNIIPINCNNTRRNATTAVLLRHHFFLIKILSSVLCGVFIESPKKKSIKKSVLSQAFTLLVVAFQGYNVNILPFFSYKDNYQYMAIDLPQI